MKKWKRHTNCKLNKIITFWAGEDTTVAGRVTFEAGATTEAGAITVPGLVPSRPITGDNLNWLTLDKFSTKCHVVGDGGCAFADAYIHSAECKLNLEALEAADQCIRKVLFRAVWGEAFPDVDIREYDDVLTLAVTDDIAKMNDYLLIKCKLLNLSLKCRQDVCEYMKKEREGPAGKFSSEAGYGHGHCFYTDPVPKCYHYILLDDGLNTPGQATGGFCHEAN